MKLVSKTIVSECKCFVSQTFVKFIFGQGLILYPA